MQSPFSHKLLSSTSSVLQQALFSVNLLSPASSFLPQAPFSYKHLSPTSPFLPQASFSYKLLSPPVFSPTSSFLPQSLFSFKLLSFPISFFLQALFSPQSPLSQASLQLSIKWKIIIFVSLHTYQMEILALQLWKFNIPGWTENCFYITV